jgi:hypothetical protein
MPGFMSESFTLFNRFPTTCFVENKAPCKEDRAGNSFDATMFPWFLKPKAELEARKKELEKNLEEKDEADDKARKAWQKEWVELGVLLTSGRAGSSKEDWGCWSGKCEGGVCEGWAPNKAFTVFKDPGPEAYVPPERKKKSGSGSGALALIPPTLCLIALLSATARVLRHLA